MTANEGSRRVRLDDLGLSETINAQLDETLDALREVLGSDLIAAYIYGSATLGGLKPRSDVDVLAVAQRPTMSDERRSLGDRFRLISARPSATNPRRSIELTIVVAGDVNPVRQPPRTDFQFGEWLRSRFDDGQVDPENPNDTDLVVLLTEALQHARPLLGPPAAQLVAAVDRNTLESSMLATLPALLAPDKVATDTANVLLTLARIWITLATGEIAPKDVAADWASARLEPKSRWALEKARETYVTGAYDDWDVAPEVARMSIDALVGGIGGEQVSGYNRQR